MDLDVNSESANSWSPGRVSDGTVSEHRGRYARLAQQLERHLAGDE